VVKIFLCRAVVVGVDLASKSPFFQGVHGEVKFKFGPSRQEKLRGGDDRH